MKLSSCPSARVGCYPRLFNRRPGPAKFTSKHGPDLSRNTPLFFSGIVRTFKNHPNGLVSTSCQGTASHPKSTTEMHQKAPPPHQGVMQDGRLQDPAFPAPSDEKTAYPTLCARIALTRKATSA